MKKVVSFCLYGCNATYIIGMKENIKLAKQYYSDWEVRIYHNNTVPEKYINEYKELNAKCILCENIGENKLNWEGMFWRWLPLDDPDVDIWISRDADSRLSDREAKIVHEWINSGKTLHSIRDHRCHFNYIMGGLFGINNKLFHEKYKFNTVSQIIKELSVYYKERPYNVDQIFLNDNLWKILKDDVMAHLSKDGRRVYPTDILIPSVPDFIGKQYRLNDFPENIIKHLDKNKGCYWKESTSSSVYWSNSSIDIKPDVKFNNQDEFFMHRAEYGFPQNWSQIQILDGVDINKNIESDPHVKKEINTQSITVNNSSSYKEKFKNLNVPFFDHIYTKYRSVYILDSKDKRINPIVKALFNDLMGGFKRLGFNVITEINKIDDIDDYSIIFVDNNIKNDIIDILCLKNKNCVYFGWCCHELERDFNNLKFIFTTTHTLTPRGKQKELVNNTKNYCPLYHRADEDPNKIGTFERNVIYDWCYTGWKYRDDLIPSKFKGLNKGVKSHMGYLSSDERRKVYLSSFVHLAYVGDTNIKDSAIPQRIFEGLGYGCIVLTNSKPACEHTENIVEYVESLKDVEEKINYYLNNPELVKKKQELAYEFIKKCGTNYFTIEKLNSKSKELFDIDFLKNIDKNNEENIKLKIGDIIDDSIIKNNIPLVSIAISTFESGGKGHELLKHNLDHILKQDYSNIEIVISDHSSDNKIKKICEDYNGKKYPIKYIHNPEHKGNSSQNTNNAIKYCNGEYIKILFMDDYLYNESAISIIMQQFKENPDKKWLVHSYKHTKDYKEFYNLHHPKFSYDIVFCNRIGTPSCLTIHNSVKERFDENLKWFMDCELYKRILDKYGQPIFLHTKDDVIPLMINLHHDGQVTNTSIDKDLIVKEKEYITNKTHDKTLMELVDNSRTDKNTIHAYLELYEKLFKSKKITANNILEVGLGQRGNCHCGSAKLWYDYFLNADIYGIEIYDETYVWEGIKNKERIKIYTSTNAYNEIEFNEKLLKKNIKFDILLDDGSHILDDMKQFIKLYTQILKEDGILIIEDIPKIEWLDILKNEVPEHLKSYIKTYDLRDKKNRFDDIVFTIDLS